MVRVIAKMTAMAAFFLGLAAPISPVAMAQSTGFDIIHSQMSHGSRVCFVDHEHYGGGRGATRRAAVRAAVASWSSFTALEYGESWGRFSRAKNKTIKCRAHGSGRSTSWTCGANAVPCRSKGGAMAKRTRRPHRKSMSSTVSRQVRKTARGVNRTVRRSARAVHGTVRRTIRR